MGKRLDLILGRATNLFTVGTIIVAAVGALGLGHWATKFATLPPPAVFALSLGVFAVVVHIFTAFRINWAFPLVDYIEVINPKAKGVRWRIWVWDSWDGEPPHGKGQRKILASCSKCDKAIGEVDLVYWDCPGCGQKMPFLHEYEQTMKEVIADMRVIWSTTRAGFSRVVSPIRRGD